MIVKIHHKNFINIFLNIDSHLYNTFLYKLSFNYIKISNFIIL
jgi:hypothetical protein